MCFVEYARILAPISRSPRFEWNGNYDDGVLPFNAKCRGGGGFVLDWIMAFSSLFSLCVDLKSIISLSRPLKDCFSFKSSQSVVKYQLSGHCQAIRRSKLCATLSTRLSNKVVLLILRTIFNHIFYAKKLMYFHTSRLLRFSAGF